MGWRNLKTLRQERLTDEPRSNSEDTVIPVNSDTDDHGNGGIKNLTIDTTVTTVNEEGVIDNVANKKTRPMSI